MVVFGNHPCHLRSIRVEKVVLSEVNIKIGIWEWSLCVSDVVQRDRQALNGAFSDREKERKKARKCQADSKGIFTL